MKRASEALLFLPLLLLLANPSSGDVPTPMNDEVLGLLVFKSGISDPTAALSSWTDADSSPCGWAHLQCDPTASAVLLLSLTSLSLSGRIPRGLDRLRSLHSLSLAGNRLSGEIPTDLSLLHSLTSLSLAGNSLSGRVPADLGRLPALRSLDLSANSLSGPLPDTLFSSSLRFLDLSGNHLEGPIPSTFSQCPFLLHANLSGNALSGSPAVLFSLSRLRVLDLSRNSFSGSVPDTVSNIRNLKILRLNSNGFSRDLPDGIGLCLHLEDVDFSYNLFDGALPSSIQSLTSLTSLCLSNNKFSGEVPAWIGNLTALRQLDISSNELTGNVPASLAGLKELNQLWLSDNLLAGEIPTSIAGCEKLNEVRMKGNRLNGSIPRALLDLGLEVLDLSCNGLDGEVPPGSAKLSETLRWLDLSSNRLTGVIPMEMALYFNLRYLNLSWNHLHSPLPPELGYFRNLSVLDLRGCSLYGLIPEDLCESGSLSVLQLDGNSLEGPIPLNIGNCSSLSLLSLSHNNLSGSIPVAISRLKQLKILNLEFNDLHGEIPPQLAGLENLLAVNISHNRLVGRLPTGGIFQSLDESSLRGNLGLCTPLVAEPCKMNVPKPLVLDPNAYNQGKGNGNGNGNDDDPVAAAAAAATMSPLKPRRRRFLSVSSIVAISAAILIALGVLAVSLLNVTIQRRIGLTENSLESMCSSSAKSGGLAVGKTVLFGARNNLRSEDLVGGAESLLSKATEIGRGLFGTVYKVPIGSGRIIAIKKLLASSVIKYQDDFDSEVQTLGKARHPNLMPLKGYYWTPQLQLLITDYAQKGSLHSRLHERSGETPPLPWADRFKIVLGTARGLAHLHSFRPPIVHYNLKPSNILLDEDCNPMVSDFGLVRLLPKFEQRFQSGAGYVAPELACRSVRVNERCDAYGFGVLALELVTGRRVVEYGDDGEDAVVVLMDVVRVALEEGNVMECVDEGMGGFPEEEVLPVLKLGLVCTSQIPSSRPSMAEVVQILQVIKTPVLERMEAF